MEVLWYMCILVLALLGVVLIVLGKTKGSTESKRSTNGSTNGSTEPHYSYNKSQSPETGVAPKQFRIAPAFLDDDAVDAYSNGKVPMRISWIEWEGGSGRPPTLKINGSSVNWDWTGWECDIGTQLAGVPSAVNKQVFEAGSQKMSTVRVDLKPGSNEFILDSYTFTINTLGLRDSTRILWVGDPNIGDPNSGSWSQIDSQSVLNNTFNQHKNDIDAIVFIGDNFYDQVGSITKDFWNGDIKFGNYVGDDSFKLDPDFYKKTIMMVIGNHDYNPMGDGVVGSGGRSLLQWYGQDYEKSPWNGKSGDDWCSGSKTMATEYDTGLYVVGDTGFIVGDNSTKLSNSYLNNQITTFWKNCSKLGVKKVFYTSHWQITGMDAVISGPDQAAAILEKRTDSTIKMGYVLGHEHQNYILNSNFGELGGWIAGGNGQNDNNPGLNCWTSNNCCPTYWDGDKMHSQKQKGMTDSGFEGICNVGMPKVKSVNRTNLKGTHEECVENPEDWRVGADMCGSK